MNILIVLVLITLIYICYRLTSRRENLSYQNDLCDDIYKKYEDANNIFGSKKQCKSALHTSVGSSVMNQCNNLSSTTQEFKECAQFLGNKLTQTGVDDDNFDSVVNSCGSESQTTDEFKHCVNTHLQPHIQGHRDKVNVFCDRAVKNNIYSSDQSCSKSMAENPITINNCMLNCANSQGITAYTNCFYGNNCLQ